MRADVLAHVILILVLEHYSYSLTTHSSLWRTFDPMQCVNFPKSDTDDVEFLLYNKKNFNAPIVSYVDDKGLLFDGAFQREKETKIVIHGWLDDGSSEFAQTMVSVYLSQSDYNVIVVSWSAAKSVIYPLARYNVGTVGDIVAVFLGRLVDEYGLDLTGIHMIGHSLGAHISGVVGYHLSRFPIGKITGLDPAGFLFTVNSEDRLSPKAANFVEVVHTCSYLAGIADPIGHVDFYPNGGLPFQPGCKLDIRCSHIRSYKYYAESIINDTSFLATQCSTWVDYLSGECEKNASKLYMNGKTATSARGQFYFKTASAPPFGLGPDS